MIQKRGIVFGVFDGLHEGHRHLLESAKEKCAQLVVVVATDSAARALKGRGPLAPLSERISAIVAFDSALTVVAGDEAAGSWEVLKTYAPDVVFLGYDQQAIASELDARAIPYMYLSAHEPHRFKSSIARENS